MSIQDLLSSPNPDDTFPPRTTKRFREEREETDKNIIVAEHWKTNEREAVEREREWTKRYASNG